MLPPFGLSGGAMRFDPASACLWIDTDRATLRAALHNLEQGTRDLGVNILTTYSSGWIPHVAAMQPADRHLICRIRHELDHLRRHLGTSFGLLYHFINSSFPPVFFEVANMRAAAGELHFPLFDPALERRSRTLGYAAVAAQDDEASAFVVWQSAKELLRALDGDSALIDPSIALWRFDTLLATLAGGRQGVAKDWQQRLNKALLPYVSRRNAVLPQWQGVEFGGRHLLEALAFGAEASFALLTGVDPALVADGMDEDHYGLIAAVWAGLIDEPPTPPPGPAMPHVPDVPLRSLAYLAAVDLALWLPVGPTGLVGEATNLSWSDVHPGWRFLKICDALRYLDTTDTQFALAVEDTNAPFRTLQNRICTALGWPTVDQIAADWLRFLVPQLEAEQWSGFFWESGRAHPRQASSVALLSRRLVAPYQIAFNYYDFSAVKLMFFPILFARDGHLTFAPDQAMWRHFETPEARRAMPFFVYHGVRKLAEGKDHALHMGPAYDAALLNYLALHGEPFGVDPATIRAAAADYLRA